MYSIINREWARALFHGLFHGLDEARARGATFAELMALIDGCDRLRREVTTLEYELTSPIGRLAGRKDRGG